MHQKIKIIDAKNQESAACTKKLNDVSNNDHDASEEKMYFKHLHRLNRFYKRECWRLSPQIISVYIIPTYPRSDTILLSADLIRKLGMYQIFVNELEP